MRRSPLTSPGPAAPALLTIGSAGCGDWQSVVEDILKHSGEPSPTPSTDAGVAPTCDYEGKPYPLGATFPASDGCNKCSCDKSGLTCTKLDCSGGGGSTGSDCEKVPVTGENGACVPYPTWKMTSVDICTARGAVLTDLVFSDTCEDGQSTRQAILVCCKARPANDVQCQQTKDADGKPCTLCVDANGVVVKTDCRNPQ